MSLSNEERQMLVSLYMSKAWQTYKDANVAAEAGRWGMAANRLYYSLFHAATTLFVNDGVEVGSHKGVKAKLGQYYIVTGKMSVDHSKFLAQMETLRDKADYNIMFVASEEDVLPNIPLAEFFIKEIEKMISE